MNHIIGSYNCKNVKSSIEEIVEPCSTSDIIFLQDTWLLEDVIASLSSISKDHNAVGMVISNWKCPQNSEICILFFCKFARKIDTSLKLEISIKVIKGIKNISS